MSRIVASLTTIPGREKKIIDTIQSIKRQTRQVDCIYICIPKQCKRLGNIYDLPEEIKQSCTIIETDIDYGPIMKILGPLIVDEPEDTYILSIDDDTVYPNNLVELYYSKALERPHTAIGATGLLIKYMYPLLFRYTDNITRQHNLFRQIIPDNGLQCDILYGSSGIMYQRNFFPPTNKVYTDFIDYALTSRDIYMSDDVLISGYLSKQGIDRYIYDTPEIIANIEPEEFAICYDMINFIKRLSNSIQQTKDWGMFDQTAPMSILDSVISGNIVCLVTFILIILAFIYFAYWYNIL